MIYIRCKYFMQKLIHNTAVLTFPLSHYNDVRETNW